MGQNNKTDYVYIVGAGGSGSTLLEILLGNHPEFVAMGEIERLHLQFARGKDGKCSCGEMPKDCKFWSALADKVREVFHVDLRSNPFDFRVSDVGWEEHLPVKNSLGSWIYRGNSRLWRYMFFRNKPILKHGIFLAKQYRKWAKRRTFVADFVRDYHKVSAVIDNSKDYLAALDLYETLQDRMKIIFITRDARATTWSTLKRYYRGKGISEEELGSVRDTHQWNKSTKRIGKSWYKTNSRTMRLLKTVPESLWLHLRYEDLCHDPEGELTRIFEFLGFPYDPGKMDLKSHEVHTIGGNKIRFSPIKEIKEDLSWKDNLKKNELEIIESITGDLLKELGY